MREIGIVAAVDGSHAVVNITAGEQCNGCTVCRSMGENRMQVIAHNRAAARAGDMVAIEVAPSKIIKNSFIVFIFPLLMLIIGYVLCSEVLSSSSQGAGIIGSLTAVILSFVIIRLTDVRRRRQGVEDVEVVEILPPTS